MVSGHSFIEAAELHERLAKIVVGFGKVGLQRQHLAVGGEGGFGLAFGAQGVGEVVVGLGEGGVQGDGAAVGSDRVVDEIIGGQSEAEIDVGGGMVGL